MTKDEIYMQRCLELAACGAGSVEPNPRVGSVIVYQGRIIGEGYHMQYGGPHAEVNAIASVENRSLLRQSTLYVNLEPCAHEGKTPPCAGLIAGLGIPRVVIGTVDPFEKVNGKGIAIMESAGCQVTAGVLEKESKAVNKRFFTFHKEKRPYMILKWAQSADGFIDRERDPQDGIKPEWITDEVCRFLVHKWRTEESGIMIGANTAVLDDPRLTARLYPGRQPVRILVDPHLRVPGKLKIFDTSARVIVMNGLKDEEEGHIRRRKIDMGEMPGSLLTALHQEEVQSVIVEGGTKLLQTFIDAGSWDEARIFTGPVQFGKGVRAPVPAGRCISESVVGNSRLAFRIP